MSFRSISLQRDCCLPFLLLMVTLVLALFVFGLDRHSFTYGWSSVLPFIPFLLPQNHPLSFIAFTVGVKGFFFLSPNLRRDRHSLMLFLLRWLHVMLLPFLRRLMTTPDPPRLDSREERIQSLTGLYFLCVSLSFLILFTLLESHDSSSFVQGFISFSWFSLTSSVSFLPWIFLHQLPLFFLVILDPSHTLHILHQSHQLTSPWLAHPIRLPHPSFCYVISCNWVENCVLNATRSIDAIEYCVLFYPSSVGWRFGKSWKGDTQGVWFAYQLWQSMRKEGEGTDTKGNSILS